MPEDAHSPDILWVEVRNIVIGCLYLRPAGSMPRGEHANRPVEILANALDSFANRKILLMGDTNARCGVNQSYGKPRRSKDTSFIGRGDYFTQEMRKRKMSILNGSLGRDLQSGGEYTCFANSKTIVDHALASELMADEILDFEVLPYSSLLSDHAAISCTIKRPRATAEIIPEETPEIERNIVSMPTAPRRPFSGDLPWKVESKKRRGKAALRVGRDEAYSTLERLRKNSIGIEDAAAAKAAAEKLVTKLNRSAKRQRVHRELERIEENPDSFFAMRKKDKRGSAAGAAGTGPPVDAHAAHYESLGSTASDRQSKNSLTKVQTRQQTERQWRAAEWAMQKDKDDVDAASPFTRPFTLEEVKSAVAKIKDRKTSSGADDIKWEDIAQIPPDKLLKLCQDCVDGCSVPETWLIGEVVPIPKSSTVENDPRTYRGITLESCGLKFVGTLICLRLQEFGNDSGLLPEEQNGFRTGYRTENSPFVFHTLLDKARHEGKDIFAAFIDLAKAFDSVDRNLLWLKMEKAGAKGPIFDLIRYIYDQMLSQVRVGKEKSFVYRTELGVLQGDPMSGMLFIIFVAAMERELLSTKHSPHIGGKPVRLLLMADDIALIAYSKSELNMMLDSLSRYCEENLLTISIPKSVYVSFEAGGLQYDCREVVLDENELKAKTGARYIGIHFAEKKPLHYGTHISTLAATGQWHIMRLLDTARLAKDVLSTTRLVRLYDTEIRSKMLFGAEVTITAPNLDAMIDVEKGFLRRLLHLPPSSPVGAMYLEVGLIPIEIKQLEKAITFYLYASASTAPTLVRTAMWDAVCLRKSKKISLKSWFACLRERLAIYFNADVLPPMNSADGIDWDQREGDPKSFGRAMMKSIEEFYRCEEQEKLQSNKKLALIAAAPLSKGVKPYLDLLPPSHRFAMARLRLGGHPLAIEIGTYENVPREERICRFCTGSRFVEDVLHVFGTCMGDVGLFRARIALVNDLDALQPAEIGGCCNMALLSRRATWDKLLNSDTDDIVKIIGPYVAKCFKIVEKRKWRRPGT